MKAAIQVEIETLDDLVKAAAEYLCDEHLIDLLKQLRAARSSDDVARLRDEIEVAVNLPIYALLEAYGHLGEMHNLLTEGEAATA